MKYKNNRELKGGVDNMLRLLLAVARSHSRDSARYLKMYRTGHDWAYSDWINARSRRRQIIYHARVLRDYTHDGVGPHIAGERVSARMMKRLAA